ALYVLVGRLVLCVEARARTVTREPVEPLIASVDRPDERLVERVQIALAGMEDLDRRVLAHVPELGHGSDLSSAAGSGQKRSSAASSRGSHRYSSCSSFRSGSQPGSTSTRKASTCTPSPGSRSHGSRV